jgi:hypothetical protein
MHHLQHKSEKGATTVENGANVAEVAHQYMHSLPREQEEIINDMLREWKHDFKLGVVELTTEGIKQAQVIEPPEAVEECIEIPLEPMTEEELKKYEEHKRKRNERVFKKFENYER